MSVCCACLFGGITRSISCVKMTFHSRVSTSGLWGAFVVSPFHTVLPLPVASEIPSRLWPLSRYERTDWMHSSWYSRSRIPSSRNTGEVAWTTLASERWLFCGCRRHRAERVSRFSRMSRASIIQCKAFHRLEAREQVLVWSEASISSAESNSNCGQPATLLLVQGCTRHMILKLSLLYLGIFVCVCIKLQVGRASKIFLKSSVTSISAKCDSA